MKTQKKYVLAVALGLALLAVLALWPRGGVVKGVEREVGESQYYSEKELLEIMKIAEGHFRKNFPGCILKTMTYDEAFSTARSEEWAQTYGADRAIVLTSSFDVGASGGDGSLNPNTTYIEWQWILTQSSGENWSLRAWGYG